LIFVVSFVRVHRVIHTPSFKVLSFYRVMHFSAKRGLAIACHLSVCPSVCLWHWWFVITLVGNLGN